MTPHTMGGLNNSFFPTTQKAVKSAAKKVFSKYPYVLTDGKVNQDGSDWVNFRLRTTGIVEENKRY
jgi:hypothetical protein